MGQVRGLDLQHGDFQPRIAAQELGVIAAAVVQGDGDAIGVQHVAQGGEDVPSAEIKNPL